MNNWHGKLRIKPAQSLILFVCWWIVSWVLGSVLISHIGLESTTRLRWATVVQDIVMFILPVIMTMLLIAQRPWRIMGISRTPNIYISTFGILAFITAIPWMNTFVLWNESIHFPAELSGIEQALRTSEDAAESMVRTIMGGTGIMNLIVSVLIVGLLTGVAEELFFRGGLQQLLYWLFGNVHVAIWVAAFVFSAIHMQFFGFFPRLLMGAYFGYLLRWSRSLWLPIFVHAMNNSLIVIFTWLSNNGNADFAGFERFGTSWEWCLGSVVFTALFLWRAIQYYTIRHSRRPFRVL
ncbi:MAG: CPBP family intramembrane metalloprotease [Muribaculum sp.]|nr:CPBP family intramembrane metalloprotease [Muribaculaceae bacterium]MCM1081404.1 CPBP family intramembrane metalloprotease [Muribaculum sp.]